MTKVSVSSTLPNLEAFCRTFELGSFTRAARALSVTPQATSRSVARLEAALGVALFRRTTRSLGPTDEARRYYELCRQALALLSAGERELSSRKGAPEGHVRVSVPTPYAHAVFLRSLADFRARHPGVRVTVHVSSENVDFVRDRCDFAIRMGALRDGSLVARRLGVFSLGVYASPSYLARRGAPRVPERLVEHTCLAFVLPRTGKVLPWSFDPAPRAFVPDAPLCAEGDALANVTLARAGAGLVQIYDFVVADDLARGALVEVLEAYRGAARPFSLVYPRGAALSRAARALYDWALRDARERARGHDASAALTRAR